MSAFITYRKSFLWPGISLSLLYLTVLGFDSVTTDYASEKGVNETTLILVRVGANVAGVIGGKFFNLKFNY
jgi:iron-regulated transporter 1